MIKLEKFKIEDKEILSKQMIRAFNADSQMHLGIDDGPPGYNNGEFIDEWFMHKNATPLTIYEDDKIIGGVNLWIKEDNINYLGCLFIDPDYENKGIGLEVWKKIENMFPSTIEWRTETPSFSHRNHNFYVNKCGFVVYKIENPKNVNDGSFLLKKRMK